MYWFPIVMLLQLLLVYVSLLMRNRCEAMTTLPFYEKIERNETIVTCLDNSY